MDLYIYNSAIELHGVIDSFSSLRWRRRFFEPGEFELHCPATAENISLLTEDNIVHRLDRSEAGIIEGISIQEKDDCGDEIVATGRMGSSILDRRIITPAINFTGTVEAAMRKLVSDNAVKARPITGLTLGELGGSVLACSFDASQGKNLLEALEALSRSAPLGFRARLDVSEKAWLFEAYDGTDRTVTQTERPYVLFSDEFQNISSPVYTLNNQSYKNYAYVSGESIVEVDRTGSETRRELWVDASDLTSTISTEDDFTGDGSTTVFTLGHTPAEIKSIKVGDSSASDYTLNGKVVTVTSIPVADAAVAISYSYTLIDTEYAAQLTQRGLEKLAEAVKTESISADAVNTGNFLYLSDWDLGDIVSFEKWGLRLDQRITEVEEVYENGIETVTPTCGSPLPETLDLGDDT